MDKPLTKQEYLEIKKQALIDRKSCEAEIERHASMNKEDSESSLDNFIKTLLDTYALDYEGDAKVAYRSNFLIPNDAEFKKLYDSRVRSLSELSSRYPGSTTSDISGKITCINRFNIYNNIADIDEELARESMEKLDFPVEETTYDEDDFDTLDTKADDNVKKVEQTHQCFSPLARSKENDVEKQTEDALEKINYLFRKNDTKEEKIKTLEKDNEDKDKKIAALEKEAVIKDAKITSLESEIERLRGIIVSSEERIDELNVEKIGLEEENAALKQQSDRIIAAINEKYGEQEETHKKRV